MAPNQAPRQIPGYYYDAAKGKYFKIEKTATAPSSAAWSLENVKRRKVEDKQAALQRQQVVRNKDRVRRAPVLESPLTGDFLARELGGCGSRGRPRDVVAGCFVDGLVEKGCLPLGDARWGGGGGMRRNVQHMYVDGQDRKTGICTAFLTIDGDSLVSTYVPRDSNGRVHRRLLADYHTPPTHVAPYQEITVSQISDIKCHQLSSQILITCRSPGPDVSFWAFSPKVTAADDPRPNWLLSWNGSSVYRCIRTPGRNSSSGQNTSANAASTIGIAPPGSDLTAMIGTNSGIVQWHNNGTTSWLTPETSSFPSSSSAVHGAHRRHGKHFASSVAETNPFRDIFAIEFQHNNPRVALFGGRPGSLWIGDTRMPVQEWDSITVPSSIAHIRSVREHLVLVAGLKNTLALYDLRFRKTDPGRKTEHQKQHSFHGRHYGHHASRGRGRGGNIAQHDNTRSSDTNNKNADRPVLRFREYRNAAHVDIGFDYDPDSGAVAAAHDDGTVALYSVRAGHRLLPPSTSSLTSSSSFLPSSPSPFSALSASSLSLSPTNTYSHPSQNPASSLSNSATGKGRSDINKILSERGPIQSIQWQKFPRDLVSSLFVGVQSNINVYSFGVRDFDDEA